MVDLSKVSVNNLGAGSQPASHVALCWQWVPQEGPKGALIRKGNVSWKYLVAFKHHFFQFYFLLISEIKCQYYRYGKREGMSE